MHLSSTFGIFFDKIFLEVLKMRFSELLTDLRKEYNLSQMQLAEQIGVSQSTIAKLEIGRYLRRVRYIKTKAFKLENGIFRTKLRRYNHACKIFRRVVGLPARTYGRIRGNRKKRNHRAGGVAFGRKRTFAQLPRLVLFWQSPRRRLYRFASGTGRRLTL